MCPYIISRHRARKMTVIPTYTFNCRAAAVLPEKTSVFLATLLIVCDLGRKVTEPTANVELLKKSFNSFLYGDDSILLEKVSLGPRMAFP